MQTATKMKPSRILLIIVAFASIIFCANEAKGQVFILTNDQQLRDLANSPEKEHDTLAVLHKPLPEHGKPGFVGVFLNAGGVVLRMSAPPMLCKAASAFGVRQKFETNIIL